MTTVIRRVPFAEVPEAWREGLGEAAMVEITLRVEPESPDELEGSKLEDRLAASLRPLERP